MAKPRSAYASVRRCNLHKTGVTTYAIGKRFYTEDCPECEVKRARGEVGPGDPTAHELMLKFGQDRSAKTRRRKMIEARMRRVA